MKALQRPLLKILTLGIVFLSFEISPICALEEIPIINTEAKDSEETCVDGTCESSEEGIPEGNPYDDYMTEDFEDPCRDTHDQCGFWASMGECENNRSFMHKACILSCDLCTAGDESEEVEEKACEDEEERCWMWAAMGECLVNGAYMRKVCRLSCWSCVDEAEGDEGLLIKKKIYLTLDPGVSQQVVGEEIDKNATKSILWSTEIYLKEHVTAMNLPDRQACRNDFELCSFWASIGHCHDMTPYMITMCPLACQMCDMREKFEECGVKHDSEGALVSKSFEGLFNWITETRNLKHQFITAKPSKEGNQPFMVRFDNLLTDQECDHLISLGDNIGWDAPPAASHVTDDVILTPPAHTGVTSVCDDRCQTDRIYNQIASRVANLPGLPVSHLEPLQLFKFSPDEQFSLHHDLKPTDNFLPPGPRIMTLYIFLSDVEEGGQLGFPNLDWLMVKPKKGSAVLWANVLDEDILKRDARMVNEDLPVVKGTKVGGKFFMHQYDWREGSERGCA